MPRHWITIYNRGVSFLNDSVHSPASLKDADRRFVENAVELGNDEVFLSGCLVFNRVVECANHPSRLNELGRVHQTVPISERWSELSADAKIWRNFMRLRFLRSPS